jgi:hypothetical protein
MEPQCQNRLHLPASGHLHEGCRNHRPRHEQPRNQPERHRLRHPHGTVLNQQSGEKLARRQKGGAGKSKSNHAKKPKELKITNQ